MILYSCWALSWTRRENEQVHFKVLEVFVLTTWLIRLNVRLLWKLPLWIRMMRCCLLPISTKESTRCAWFLITRRKYEVVYTVYFTVSLRICRKDYPLLSCDAWRWNVYRQACNWVDYLTSLAISFIVGESLLSDLVFSLDVTHFLDYHVIWDLTCWL